MKSILPNQSASHSPVQSAAQLGVLVRSSRLAMGLTQPQLALAAGCGLRFIVELEAGKPTVRFENVMRVVQALGASLHFEAASSSSTKSK
ncbi:MAG: helix-turn-helix transcriptional regulator [Brachymonas sp.]|nr:helix-turn-helix transcriptional regulator [Brachymonas sp.]